MNQIKAKIYYLISTGDILTVTSEMQGCKETIKEQDVKICEQLKDRNVDEIDFIELEYGTLINTFTNIKSYKVNVETKKLDCVYFTKEEVEERRKQYEQQNQQAQLLNSRVSDISQYLSNNEKTISDTEDLILKSEQNKILKSEGMM